MPVWHYIAGCAVLIAAIAAIVLMIYMGCAAAVEEAAKEARADAHREARRLAEREFRQMVQNTEYRVHFTVRIVDEMHQKG